MLTGGCFCGAVRFEIAGEVHMRALCLCRTCQKISGGGGNFFVGVLAKDFRYTAGSVATFSKDALHAPTREFCGQCGVHIAARSPKAPGGLVVKVGALDDPGDFAGPDMVFWCEERESFHLLPVLAKTFDRLPSWNP